MLGGIKRSKNNFVNISANMLQFWYLFSRRTQPGWFGLLKRHAHGNPAKNIVGIVAVSIGIPNQVFGIVGQGE